MFEIEDINAGYGKIHVLFDINAKVKDKDITVLVGPNGSGKSTLLKTVLGITQVYSGKILFEGRNVVGLPPHVVTKMGIAYLPQVDNVFSNLNVRENLHMAGYILGRDEAKERAKDVLGDFPVLNEYMNRKAGTLSGGERQMLAMAMAMMRRPKIMLFDEPTSNLAPKMALQVLEKIVSLRDDHGMTLLLAEQNARRALEHGDKALLLVSGQLVFDGKAQGLLCHDELAKLYLGIKVEPNTRD
ncbi:MAG: ABC transporter ATP-binding protein [Candidatus Bathyarchaeia archaeon]